MADKTSIFNAALVHIGAALISDHKEQSEEAALLRSRYDQVRDATLRSHPWNSARARKAIPSAGAPDFEFARKFPLPNDPFCLRVISLFDTEERFIVEGREILTDAPAPLKVKFVFRLQDEGLMDPLLVETLSLHLALSVAYSQSDSSALEDKLWTRYVAKIREARNIDGQEGTPTDSYESEIIAVRR